MSFVLQISCIITQIFERKSHHDGQEAVIAGAGMKLGEMNFQAAERRISTKKSAFLF